MNTPAYLERIKRIVMENLRHTGGPPSVQMSGLSLPFSSKFTSKSWCVDIPSLPIDDILENPNQDEDFESPNERRPQRLLDSRRQADGELSDSDDEGEGGRRNHAHHRDQDSIIGNEGGSGRKFGMGIGIMTSGSAATHGAGPSGHNTAARMLSTAIAGSSRMDIDAPGSPPVENGMSEPHDDKVANVDMVVDEPSSSNA
jgi:histone deacetylase 1/2